MGESATLTYEDRHLFRCCDSIEETLLSWLEQTIDLMLPYLPPPSPNFTSSPPTVLPPPIYALEPVSEPNIDCLSLKALTNGHTPTNGHAPSQAAPTRTTDPGGSETKPDDWIWARLTRNKRVTPEDWRQNVREIELELEDPDL